MKVRADSRTAVLGVCVERGGYLRGARVAQFIFEWEVAVRALKRDITAEEFADWWKVGATTAYRRLAEYRKLFPEHGDRGRGATGTGASPSMLMRPLLDRLARGEQVGEGEGLDVELVPA
jgi:hypothetical protein